MALINRPVPVWMDAQGRPVAFLWRGLRRQIAEVMEEWREIGDWWDSDPPEERDVYRVLTEDGGVYELDYRQPEGRWYLYRVYD